MPRKTLAGVETNAICIDFASMRPRPDAAENDRNDEDQQPRHRASMRPRPDAAENGRIRLDDNRDKLRFNEAAARCRGKQSAATSPRPIAGRRFNEAAARCRGKPIFSVRSRCSGSLLQ